MKRFYPLAFVSLLTLPLFAEPSTQEHSESIQPSASMNEEAKELRSALRQSRQELHQQLENAANAQEKRTIIEQWRQDNEVRINQERALRTAEGVHNSAQATPWERPEIPEGLPAEKREKIELRYDLREARMTLQAELKDAFPQERREAINAFREQNKERMNRLRELSMADQLGNGPRFLELREIPNDLSEGQKERLQARNERIAAINELNEALANATLEERRQALSAYRSHVAKLREESLLKESPAQNIE